MKSFLLSAFLLCSTNAFANFKDVLTLFPQLPSSLTDSQVQHLAASEDDVHYYFNEHGYSYTRDALVPIAKLDTEFGYFLLTAKKQQINKNSPPYVLISGYSIDKKGNLIEKNPYILSSGRFNDQQHSASFWKDGTTFHFYTHTVDNFTDQQEHEDMIFELTSKKMEYEKTNKTKPKKQ